MNRIIDWATLTGEQAAALYDEQTRAWNGSLGWDLTPSWAVVERARAAGALAGRVCMNARGAIVGWTFFMRQADVLQIGALSGRGASPVRALLESILDAPEAAGARELTCLLYPAPANVLSALARRRFDLQALHYLTRPAGAGAEGAAAPEAVSIRRWTDDDAVACVRILARAYGRSQSGRGLAPNGTIDEWAHYLRQVLRTPACGTLVPRASYVAEERDTGAIVGFVLATAVGQETAHVAQLAVDPSWMRRGIGRALLAACGKAASSGGFRTTTLLVGGENDAASRLYASAGFGESGRMVFASRSMPVRRQSQSRAA